MTSYYWSIVTMGLFCIVFDVSGNIDCETYFFVIHLYLTPRWRYSSKLMTLIRLRQLEWWTGVQKSLMIRNCFHTMQAYVTRTYRRTDRPTNLVYHSWDTPHIIVMSFSCVCNSRILTSWRRSVLSLWRVRNGQISCTRFLSVRLYRTLSCH